MDGECRMKQITVEDLVHKFQLKVLAGENRLQNVITQSRVHRPGLEFVGHFDFFQQKEFRFWVEKKLPIYIN